jgi:accessory colonization factor AcfC
MTTAAAFGQDVVRLYGSVGPSPAMEEAAMLFATRSEVKVEVVSGPRHVWRDKAALNADLMFSSADFMMSDYARSMDLHIDNDTITPLFLRPSAILVRPGNPKQINDFPDLVRPGVNVMVVNSAGATGLWEDMAGKLEDIRTVRALRKNIVVFAANSDEAMMAWKANADIDAWITWNTWHIPLRGRAELVPVSKDYRVLRTCSIALTERGKAKPAAVQFFEFLKSPEAAGIFDTWGWMAPDVGSKPVTIGADIAVVCRVHEDRWNKEAGVGEDLLALRRILEEYKAIGIPLEELHVNAIFHGDAARWLLNDEAYRGPGGGREGENPNKTIIRELIRSGVSIEMCGLTMKEHGWKKEDLLPDVKEVPAAYPRLIDLEGQGYSYVSF